MVTHPRTYCILGSCGLSLSIWLVVKNASLHCRVAELRRMDATDLSNEKQVKAAALELLKRLLVIQLSLPGRISSSVMSSWVQSIWPALYHGLHPWLDRHPSI